MLHVSFNNIEAKKTEKSFKRSIEYKKIYFMYFDTLNCHILPTQFTFSPSKKSTILPGKIVDSDLRNRF